MAGNGALNARFSAICIEMGMEDQDYHRGGAPEYPHSTMMFVETLNLEAILLRASDIAAEAVGRPDDHEYFAKKIWWLLELALQVSRKREIAGYQAVLHQIQDASLESSVEDRVAAIRRTISAIDHARQLPDRLVSDRTAVSVTSFLRGDYDI